MTAEPSTPEEWSQRGLEAFRSGRTAEAIRDLQEAEAGYRRTGDRVRRAEAANNLSVALLKDARPGEALSAVRDTPEELLSLGEKRLSAMANGNLAACHEALGEWDAAEAAYRASAEGLEAAGDLESRTAAQQALSHLLLRRGRPLEAVQVMQGGLENPRAGFARRLLARVLSLPSRLLGR
jgi:tetratricopeptide (TPR) repeat protein